MTTETICAECERLSDAYYEAAIRYMRLYDGTRNNPEETRQRGEALIAQMREAKQDLFAHQQKHAQRN